MSNDGVNEETRRVASIEWFHGFAQLGRDEMARQWTPEIEGRLREHVALCLTGIEMPGIRTPEQFAEVVIDLRANESDWDRATMAAIIRADDLALAGQTEEAVHVLHAFAASCPWKLFAAVARDQAARLLGE